MLQDSGLSVISELGYLAHYRLGFFRIDSGDQNGLVLLEHGGGNGDNLLGVFGFAENHFGEPGAELSLVVDTGSVKRFGRKPSQLLQRLVNIELASVEAVEKFLERFTVHFLPYEFNESVWGNRIVDSADRVLPYHVHKSR